MALGDFKEQLKLQNVCNGELAEQFEKLYPGVVKALKSGDKGSIDIKVTFEKVLETDTMFNVSFTITQKTPARKKASICQINGDGELKTDKVQPKTISMFEKVEGGNK